MLLNKGSGLPLRLLKLAILLSLATLARPLAVAQAQQESSEKPTATAPTPGDPSSEQEESAALEKATDTASGNPQAVIKNLEDFLARFPQSPRREQILRTVYKLALQSNDPRKAATFAEKLLEANPEDPQLLATLVELFNRSGEGTSREKAAQYATRFIQSAEKLAAQRKPSDVPEAEWQEAQAAMRATAYAMRGKVYAKSSESEKAFADYEKSFATYPSARVAEQLGDLAAKRGETDRAIDYYTTAFAFPEKAADPARREQVRRKLGSLYVAKARSEVGLGDRILARYDELVRSLPVRAETQPRSNANLQDPFAYVLLRVDGSELRLSECRGKVVVMDFWATWCAPCRVEGKLFQRVMESFRSETATVFLAVNVDEDRSGVPEFVKEEQWTVPVVYAQGLDRLLGILALPTLVIFDRDGRVVFRQQGLDLSTFMATLEKKVREALNQPASLSPASR